MTINEWFASPVNGNKTVLERMAELIFVRGENAIAGFVQYNPELPFGRRGLTRKEFHELDELESLLAGMILARPNEKEQAEQAIFNEMKRECESKGIEFFDLGSPKNN